MQQDEQPLWSRHDPMRYFPAVLDIVDQLNTLGEERIGEARASFCGHRHYLAILWGDTVLWDSEGSHREDRDFGENEGFDPTLMLCLSSLAHESRELRTLLSTSQHEEPTL